MYLLTFVTLVVALIGVYAQVLSLQTSRLFSTQTSVATAVTTWHSTAIALARSIVISPLPGPTGCDLTTNGPTGVPCKDAAGDTISVQPSTVPPPGALPLCSGSVTTACWTSLPQGYQTTPYTFYSVYYQPAVGQKYVLTFVPPPITNAGNPPPGFITLPGTGAGALAQIGMTMGELMGQMRNRGLAAISFGSVATIAGVNYLVTTTISNGVTSSFFQYTLPTLGAPGVGSIGIISSP